MERAGAGWGGGGGARGSLRHMRVVEGSNERTGVEARDCPHSPTPNLAYFANPGNQQCILDTAARVSFVRSLQDNITHLESERKWDNPHGDDASFARAFSRHYDQVMTSSPQSMTSGSSVWTKGSFIQRSFPTPQASRTR